MHFNIAACLWTDHFILLKALDHLFLAKQKGMCRSAQVQEAKGQLLQGSSRAGQHKNLQPALKAGGAVTELF